MTSRVQLEAATLVNPGEHLRKVRLEKQYTIEEIAKTLKVSPYLLQALESNDFSQPLGEGYWRGHLRRYADHLDLDPKPFIEALEAQGILTPIGLKRTEYLGDFHRGPKKTQREQEWLIWVAVLVGALAFVLIGPWQQSVRDWLQKSPFAALTNYLPEPRASQPAPLQFEFPAPLVKEPPKEGEMPVSIQEISESPADSARAEGLQEPEMEALKPSATAEDVATLAESASPTEAAQPSLPAATVAETAPVTQPVAPKETAAVKMAEQSSDSENAGGTTPLPNPAKLRFTFKQACWLMVVDGLGEMRFSGIKHPKDKLDIVGPPPFKLVLGDVSKLALTVEGKTYDFSRFSGRKVVRLTLDSF